MQRKINIDECYLALISRYVGNGAKSYKTKFTIVKYYECGEYKDIISDERYKTGENKLEKIGSLFVDNNYFLLPLNSLINLDNKFVNKRKLLKLIKAPLINLNYLLYTGEKDKIMNIQILHDVFSNVKVKKLK